MVFLCLEASDKNQPCHIVWHVGQCGGLCLFECVERDSVGNYGDLFRDIGAPLNKTFCSGIAVAGDAIVMWVHP